MTEEIAPAVRGEEYRGRRAARNSMSLLLNKVPIAVVALVTTPFAINKLPLDEVGVWTLAATTLGYIAIADPGFSDIVTRYGAQGRVRGDLRVAARIATLGSLLWLAFGILMAPVVWAIVPVAMDHVQATTHLALATSVRAASVTFFYWFFAIIVFTSIQATVSGQLVAHGDLWIVACIDAATRVIYGAVMITLLLRGWTLSAIVAATVVQYVLAYLATIAAIIWRGGRPYGDPRKLDPALRRELFRFGGLLQFNSLLDTLTYETDPVVLGFALGADSAAVWSIANRLAIQVTAVASIPQSNVLPAMSASHAATEGLAAMRRIYVRAQRVIMLTGAFVAGTIIAVGPLLLKAWLGRPFTLHHSATVATVLVALVMIAGLPRQATANAILALGRVGIGVKPNVVAFVLNVVLTVALVIPFGLTGVLIGTLAAKLVATSMLLHRFVRLLEGTWRELVWSWLGPLVAVTAATAVLGRIALHFVPSVLSVRAEALVALVVFGLAYSALYAMGLRIFRYFSVADLTWLKSSAPGPTGRILTPRVIRLLAGTR